MADGSKLLTLAAVGVGGYLAYEYFFAAPASAAPSAGGATPPPALPPGSTPAGPPVGSGGPAPSSEASPVLSAADRRAARLSYIQSVISGSPVTDNSDPGAILARDPRQRQTRGAPGSMSGLGAAGVYGPATPVDQLSFGSVVTAPDGTNYQVGEGYTPIATVAPLGGGLSDWLNQNSGLVMLAAGAFLVLALVPGGRR